MQNRLDTPRIIMNTVHLLSPFAKDDSGTDTCSSLYTLLFEQHLAGQLASGTSGI